MKSQTEYTWMLLEGVIAINGTEYTIHFDNGNSISGKIRDREVKKESHPLKDDQN